MNDWNHIKTKWERSDGSSLPRFAYADVVCTPGSLMLEELLVLLEYIPEDDSWEVDGRRTYINENNATQAWLNMVRKGLEKLGWEMVKNRLRTFRDTKTCEIIEIEPGGDDCTGHYLHLMKAETANEH